MREKKSYRPSFHLGPPEGWLNDPNGLCFHKGRYHVFFQYAPESPEGGKKYWGHYSSENLLTWRWDGIAISPDTPYDKDGAYSGCAFTEDGQMELYYTGNVKHPGPYDYIYEGRGSNTIVVTSDDGEHFSEKRVLLVNSDYPGDYTCHIRDPKVWKDRGLYLMVLGARRADDHGTILLYDSRNKKDWRYAGELTTKEAFGYMWECPDVFVLGTKEVVSCCPQGVPSEEFRFQNTYQSGYFLTEEMIPYAMPEAVTHFLPEETFREWDRGFDFYAPQTFLDPKGRRILIGWAGMFDSPYGNEPGIREGWQHLLTVPRVLRMGDDGKIRQNPVEELLHLRTDSVPFRTEEGRQTAEFSKQSYEILMKREDGGSPLVLESKDYRLCYEDGMLRFSFLNETGAGRKERRIELGELKSLRLLMDESILEIYLNEGEEVFTTRYYPLQEEATVSVKGGSAEAYLLKGEAIQIK